MSALRICRFKENGYLLVCSEGISIACDYDGGERQVSFLGEGNVVLPVKELHLVIEALWRAREWLRTGTPPTHAAPPVVLGIRSAMGHLVQHLPGYGANRETISARLQALINEKVAACVVPLRDGP